VPSFGRASFACRFGFDQAHGGGAFIRAREEALLRVALALAIFVPVAASANDARVERMLKQLDPDARFEQVCDLEAMKHISKDKTYRPERSMVSALSHPKVANSTMSGTGGAFKSKGQWYQFSFKCETTPDHMKVQAFSFQIGEPIPEELWEKNGLY
jgi:hypothetical protein